MSKETMEALLRVARIATVLLDGDEARRIITGDAMFHLARKDDRYRFLTLDHYNVDTDIFLRMKKLLLRMERLEDLDFCCSLWVPVPTTDTVTLAVQNGNVGRFYDFGQRAMPTPEAVRRCMDSGELVELEPDESAKMVTVLAPVTDSMEEVAAVLELSAATGAAAEYA